MRANINTPENPENSIAFITQLLSHFSDKREGLVLVYLISVAGEGWVVKTSVNTMSAQLNMHRQTLTRFIDCLCEKGYAIWETSAGSRQPNLLHLTALVTKDVTENVTMNVTEEVTTPNSHNHIVEYSEPDRYKNGENPFATTNVTEVVTADVTKREKEQNKEENPPAPPKKEKKQEKDKNTHTTACTREKNLEQRRQQFLTSLLPYHQRYGQEMVTHFGDYWTEPNRFMTKMRFELQRTWSTPLRLSTWARNDKTFTKNNNNHDKKSRPTAAELIADAQRTAIEETERFIREAEIRRGGLPPHLPF